MPKMCRYFAITVAEEMCMLDGTRLAVPTTKYEADMLEATWMQEINVIEEIVFQYQYFTKSQIRIFSQQDVYVGIRSFDAHEKFLTSARYHNIPLH